MRRLNSAYCRCDTCSDGSCSSVAVANCGSVAVADGRTDVVLATDPRSFTVALARTDASADVHADSITNIGTISVANPSTDTFADSIGVTDAHSNSIAVAGANIFSDNRTDSITDIYADSVSNICAVTRTHPGV